jgi:plastocyanin
MRNPIPAATLWAGLFLTAAAIPAAADETPTFHLKIQNHRFAPETLTISAGKQVVLLVTNADAEPEEFESYALNREKLIPGKTTGKVYLGPLDPGSYPFFGDFHQATAQGRVIVK